MSAPEETLALAEARAEVDLACRLLCAPTPAALEHCAAHLSTAIDRLEAFNSVQRDLPDAPSSLDRSVSPKAAHREALLLSSAVSRAGWLLRSAANYHDEWRRVAGVLCAGYTERGQAGAASSPPRLHIRG